MYGKVFIIFLSTIALTEAGFGLCPDSAGEADGTTKGVPCVLIPGCNYDNGTLTALATQCSNEMSDADCEALFPCVTASAPTASCDQTLNTGTTGDETSYPYVRAPACTSSGVSNIAMQCKLSIIDQ